MPTASAQPLHHPVTDPLPGMGAIPHADGVAFRVWAPNAQKVSVIGSFNDWQAGVDECISEANGYWYININNAEPGDEYKFHLVNGEQQLQRIDPYARIVTNSVGNGVIPRLDFFDSSLNPFEMPAWNELVIYELHIGTFNAKDGHVGTFDTAIERLPHLKALGVNAVEVMPIAEFAGDYSWGYNPAHPYAVESAYGGPEAFKRFVAAANEMGIAVIVDVVYNHFGPSDISLWQFDGWHENNKGGIYFYNDWRSATPWGDTRPDYGRGEVRKYIFDNAMMWLDDYHADGLRYDMTLYIRSVEASAQNLIAEGWSLLQWINSEVEARHPGKITIAEDLQNSAELTLKREDGGAHFGTQWDAGFVHPVRAALIEMDDANRSMAAVRDAILNQYNHDAFQRVIYTESHDEVANGKQRLVSEIDPSEQPGRYAIKRSCLGAALVMTAPGIPMLFQGQEFLRDQWFRDDRPIDWHRAEEYASITTMYRDLINLRLNKAGYSAGLTGQHTAVYHVNDNDKLIAMHRWREGGVGDDVIVIFNFAEGRKENYVIGLPHDGEWKLRFNNDAGLYNEQLDETPSGDITANEEGRDGYDFSATITIGAYACLIYSQDQ
ncbi:alpha-amylase family glycosyl hydrolase [Methylophilus sp.]|uniref:alpha-amylase family glycosyl hydrolase n=1 Tax=Methylophilus sp. TaxID=29541 RepID=UPI000D43BCB9|nr:alpha-amylase family glycosyl hydrolase [Methylophilus sp.]PPD12752.1 MAG: 1,4-alpha-glucan branching protein [Methylophilus sp.]